MSSNTTIVEFINKYNYKDRDDRVIDAINTFFSYNGDALNDGIVEKFIIFGETNRQRILSLYNIPEADYKAFQKTNKVLSSKHITVNDLLKTSLMTSYHDTNKRIFIDMIAVAEYGSKFHKYFKHGVSNSAKMKFVIEKKLSNKFLIKKTGSMFLTLQAMMTTIMSDTLKTKLERLNDSDMEYIVNSISTRINHMLCEIARVYYATEDNFNAIYLQSEHNTDEGRLSLTNNSIVLQNLINLVNNYHPSTIDSHVLKILRITSPVKRFFCQKILLDTEKKYFSRISNIYIDYYTKTYSSDVSIMKTDFIPKSNTARMNSLEMRQLEEELINDIKSSVIKYVSTSGADVEDLKTNVGVINFVKVIKMYVIIKTRDLMKEV